jgi:hypothetical protein
MKLQDFVKGPEGAKRLASLQKAVAKMKSLDNSAPDSVDFRRSWKYWANIHGYLGPASKFGTVATRTQQLKDFNLSQFIPYLQGIPDQTVPDNLAKAVWATCEHSPQKGPQANFFGWHRMYLYYFERVLRWAAQDDTLRLPYWDYTDPTQTALPDAFQDTNSTLYDWRRSEALNEGLSVMNPVITDVDAYFKDPNYLAFELDVEKGVHGNVHCSVGSTCPVAEMGLVPVAANDPIFYEHHANIDRLWACWENSHAPEAGGWQDQKFSFVDETGALVTKPVKDFLDTRALGYEYDNVSQCTRNKLLQTAALQGQPSNAGPGAERYPAKLAATKAISLSKHSTSVDIALPSPKLRSLALAPGSSTVALVLRDLTVQSPPGALLIVYVAKKSEPAKRQYVGTVNWFGEFDHGMEGTTQPMTGPAQKTLEYDITDQLRTLGITSGASGLSITFEASTGLVAAKNPPKGKKVLKANPPAEFRPEAKVTIGSVELRQATAAR